MDSTPVGVEGLHPTDWGIEFRILGTDPVNGCKLDVNLVAVRNN